MQLLIIDFNCVIILKKVIETVNNHIKEDKKKERATLVARGTKLVKELNTSDENMKKAKSKFFSNCKSQEKSYESIEKEKVKGGNTAKLQKAYDKDIRKTEKSDNEYKAMVNALKQAQDKYYDSEMPALLKEFQAFEYKRVQTTKEVFLDYIKIQESHGPFMNSLNERLEESFSKIDADSDIELYVNQNRPSEERPHAIYTGYDGSIQEVSNSNSNSNTNTNVPSVPIKESKREKEPKDLKESKEPKDKKKKKEKGGDAPPPPNTNKRPKKEDKKEDVASDDIVPPPPMDLPPPPPSGPPPKIPINIPQPNDDSSGKKEEKLIAIYSYEAKDDGEMDMDEGEIITLIEKDDSGWWVGRNQKGQVGTFPSNFVETVEITEINKNFRAKYNYDADEDGELNIKEGETLFVYTETDGWYFGKNEDGDEGNFPSNYVEEV